MGRKQNKKVVPSKSKEQETSSNTPTMQELDDCRKANQTFQNEDKNSLTKALKIMEKACRNNKNSGLLHRVHAGICTVAAFDNKDEDHSKILMSKAMKLGEKAVLLSPNSIEFAAFYTRLLFHNFHYQRVVQEGQRALAIQHPIDPAAEEWMESDGNPDLQHSPKERIAALQDSLKALVNLCENIPENESMKPISEDGGDRGDELQQEFKNLTLLATTAEQTRECKLKRVLEDQNGESKEIKQTKQNPEEQRKESEEHVLAARLEQAIKENYKLLQGKFVRPQSQSDTIAVLKEKEMTLKTRLMAATLSEKMKQQAEQQVDSRPENLLTPQPQVNKDGKGKSPKHVPLSNPIILAEKRLKDARLRKEVLQQVDSCLEQIKEKILLWKSMTLVEKQNLLKLNIHDLVAQFHSTNKYLAMKVIPDPYGFVKDRQSWKFWMCWSCGEKLADSNLYYKHVLRKHVGSLSPEQLSVLPPEINKNWNGNICNEKWEALDASAALVIPEVHSEQLPSIGNGCFTTQSKMLDEKDNHPDNSSQKSTLETKEGKVRPLEKESNVEALSESSMEVAVDDIELSEHEIKQFPKDDNSSTSSSLYEAEVYDRALLIEGIRHMLKKLLNEGCLVANHVDKILKYTMQSLRSLYPGSFLSELRLSNTHHCICYLGVSQLKVIHTFLKELSEFTFERITAEENSTDEFNNYTMVPLWMECIELNGDFLCLVEEGSLQGESTSGVHSDDAPSTNGLLNWIFLGKSYANPLEMWHSLKIGRDRRVEAHHQILQKNYTKLQKYCDEKCKRLGYKEVIKDIWGLLLDELKERRSNTEYVPHSFKAILQKKQEKLEELEELERKGGIRKYMLQTIPIIFKQAGGSIIPNEKTLTEIAAIIDCGLDEGEDLSAQNSLDQADTSIKEATKLAGQHMEIELMKYDLWISATLKDMDELTKMITSTSVADYREILLPLARSYILATLERHQEKEATETFEVAKGAKLAQVSPEIKKSANEGSNQPKPQSKKGCFDKEETDSSKVAKEAKLPQVSLEIKRSVNEGSNQSKPESEKGRFDEEETNSSEVVKEAKLAQVSPEIKKLVNEGSNQSKPPSKKKKKKKKKTKKSKNRTDSKRSEGTAQLSLDQQSVEQTSDHSDSSSADHPDSKSICKSGVGGDNDLKQEEEKVRLELMMDELNLEEIVLKLQKSIESKRQLEHDWKQEAEIRKKEKEKVRHQEEMEALKVQEQEENQRQHEKDAKLQKHMAEIHNKTRRSWSSGHPLDRRSNSFVNMGGSSPDSKEQRQLLRDRWEAVMRVYNDPTTDESERPVMPSRNNDPDVEKEAHDEP